MSAFALRASHVDSYASFSRAATQPAIPFGNANHMGDFHSSPESIVEKERNMLPIMFMLKSPNQGRSYMLPLVCDMSAVISGAHYYAASTTMVNESSQLDSLAYQSARVKSTQEINEIAAEWKIGLLDRHAGKNARALTTTTKPLLRALLKYGPSAIDLRDLPFEQVNGMHLAVILRATAAKKNAIAGWNEALEMAAKALTRDGINQQDALVGLK